HYALRITHYALRITHYALRITHYASALHHFLLAHRSRVALPATQFVDAGTAAATAGVARADVFGKLGDHDRIGEDRASTRAVRHGIGRGLGLALDRLAGELVVHVDAPRHGGAPLADAQVINHRQRAFAFVGARLGQVALRLCVQVGAGIGIVSFALIVYLGLFAHAVFLVYAFILLGALFLGAVDYVGGHIERRAVRAAGAGGEGLVQV